MSKLRLLGAVFISLVAVSFNAGAVSVTHGALTSDDSTNIIINTADNIEYLRLDVLADKTYAETVAVLDTQDGGGWHIANAAEALGFLDALLSGTNVCTHDGTNVTSNQIAPCGNVSGWSDGDFGPNHGVNSDYAWFLDAGGEADMIIIGDVFGNDVLMQDYTLASSDNFAGGHPDPISWLLVRPATPVPVPAAAWLFGSGLLGLIGMARRKKAY